MTYVHAIHTENSQFNTHQHGSFLQRAKAHLAALKQAAEEVTEYLALPPESKYEIVSLLDTSTESDTSQEATPLLASAEICSPARSALQCDRDIEAILESVDEFILAQARKTIYRMTLHPNMMQDEIYELAQMVRIKLWQTLQTRQIMSLKPYIYAIVRSESIRLLRSHRMIAPLCFDAEGELFQGQLIMTSSEGMQDPAETLEQQEQADIALTEVVQAIVTLPDRQRYAMICSLKDRTDDLLALVETFRHYHLNVENIHWPKEKTEVHRLKASLSLARKKLRSCSSA